MQTNQFRTVVTAFDEVAGKGRVYFRPTDKGLVMIGLHDGAPGYVGLRTHSEDEDHCVTTATIGAIAASAQVRWQGFERWLPSVRRSSDEERGIVPWLRKALSSGLWLPDVGEGWAFLSQEWRFTGNSSGARKTDVLAVHVPTGTLGIVEFKDSDAKLSEARAQVDEYGKLWLRDAAELAPFFTDLFQAQAEVYGNADAARTIVRPEPAELFVGVASPGKAVRVVRR